MYWMYSNDWSLRDQMWIGAGFVLVLGAILIWSIHWSDPPGPNKE